MKAFRENQPEDLSRPCAAATLEAEREKSAFVAQRKVSSGDTYSKRGGGGYNTKTTVSADVVTVGNKVLSSTVTKC